MDLSAVSVLKPGAVPTLVHVAFRAGEADIGLCLLTTDGTVRQPLDSAGVTELFETYPTTGAALRSLS